MQALAGDRCESLTEVCTHGQGRHGQKPLWYPTSLPSVTDLSVRSVAGVLETHAAKRLSFTAVPRGCHHTAPEPDLMLALTVGPGRGGRGARRRSWAGGASAVILPSEFRLASIRAVKRRSGEQGMPGRNSRAFYGGAGGLLCNRSRGGGGARQSAAPRGRCRLPFASSSSLLDISEHWRLCSPAGRPERPTRGARGDWRSRHTSLRCCRKAWRALGACCCSHYFWWGAR